MGWRRAVLASTVTLALAGAATPALANSDPGLSALATDKGSLHNIARVIGAHAAYDQGLTGRGIDVALIDTGVSEVPGLDTGNVLHGPDLSFDSQVPELTQRDGFGHGTHMASIIVGRDATGTPASYKDPSRFTGIAPDARLVSVKVGSADGAVDTSQVIAAIDWVVANRNRDGLNIRVLALAYGTDGTQDPAVDPLAFAVKNARDKGIFVAVSGGNDGRDTLLLSNPASHPQVLAVGTSDTAGTVTTDDDVVPLWASRGTDKRHVDVVTPGVSVLGLRVPGSNADEQHPAGRVGERLMRGSGTSQSAAVAAGAAALLLQKYPGLTPDQVKDQFMTSASALSKSSKFSGKGMIKVDAAISRSASKAEPKDPFVTSGVGSLHQARGTSRVYDGETELAGEFDIFGNPWRSTVWATASAGVTAWSGGDHLGVGWTGRTWSGRTWSGRTWSGDAWNGRTWSGRTWSATNWSGRTWSGRTWSGDAWSGRTWSGRTWSTDDWTGRTWSGRTWSGRTWSSGGWE
jgi:serine protease AprX